MEYGNTYLDEEELTRLNHAPGTTVATGEYPEDQEPAPGPPPPIVDEEELLAAQAAADAAVAQQQAQPQPGGVFANVGQGLIGKHRDMMMQYWQETIDSVERDDHDFKNHQLPLARIKKVMKTDEEVKMISAEAPILFAKGCDVFITELTMRAWIHAEENKRRTLQKSDIAAALTKSDMFDFLIDVVPREEEKPKKPFPPASSRSGSYVSTGPPPMGHHPLQQQPPSLQMPQLRGPMPELGPVGAMHSPQHPHQAQPPQPQQLQQHHQPLQHLQLQQHPQQMQQQQQLPQQHIPSRSQQPQDHQPHHLLPTGTLPLSTVSQQQPQPAQHQAHGRVPLSPRSSGVQQEDAGIRGLSVLDRPMDEVVANGGGVAVKQEGPENYGFEQYQGYNQSY